MIVERCAYKNKRDVTFSSKASMILLNMMYRGESDNLYGFPHKHYDFIDNPNRFDIDEIIPVLNKNSSIKVGEKLTLHVETTPFTANPTLTYTTSADTYADVGSETGKEITILGVAAGSATITVTDGTLSDTISVTVTAA